MKEQTFSTYTNRFDAKLREEGSLLQKTRLEILQVNIGKLCNLACSHCHVESSPAKTRENMDRETVEAVVRLMDQGDFTTLDVTGGAPELNPNFRFLVKEATRRGLKVMDRCNLTVFYEPGMEGLPEFFKEHRIEVVASLPCYSRENVDKQRGQGTFGKSIDALLRLNQLGYGKEGTGLELHLVYNPVGPHLPPAQESLEEEYKSRLDEDFGIAFNRLFTITNMPITRYAKYLKAHEEYDAYVDLLIQSFNIHTLDGLMCRNTLSVGWDGVIYDCDFNQALEMPIVKGQPLNVCELNLAELGGLEIMTADHCFACTAGAGSSCQGALEK